jgi:hypothetical protein
MSNVRKRLHLGPEQYRDFFETAKTAGLGLFVSSFEVLRAWATYSPLALPVHVDVTEPNTRRDECMQIGLAASIELAQFYAAGKDRPELDWRALHPDEVYPFLVYHELGHRLDNFDAWEVVLIEDDGVRTTCKRVTGYVNEVLADRYAWSQLRPGEPVPLTDYGKRNEERLSKAMQLLEVQGKRTRDYAVRSLPAGQYRYVSDWMLATIELASFVGLKVDTQLLAERTRHHQGARQFSAM